MLGFNEGSLPTSSLQRRLARIGEGGPLVAKQMSLVPNRHQITRDLRSEGTHHCAIPRPDSKKYKALLRDC